jgi:hypothetical protein
MAYSNWGAWVFRNGTRMQNREDVGVFDENEANVPSAVRIFANILRNRQESGTDDYPWFKHSHHAVLGSGAVRLCGYKSSPELWVAEGEEVKKIELPQPDYNKDEWELADQSGEVTVKGQTWKWWFSQFDGNMIDLELTDPDGTVWTSRCGYCYGAGHMDDDQARDEVGAA